MDASPEPSELAILDQLAKTVDRIQKDVYSTQPKAPGLMVRLDRIERGISYMLKVLGWLAGGGMVGLFGALYLLYRILSAVDKAGIFGG